MTPTVHIELDERRAELKAVLESKEFLRTPALAKLLSYLCEKTFEGKVHEIKEFSIATEVYGKNQQFGERRDSVVRVEVARLRKRLRSYYEREGSDHALRIQIPVGTYQPEFESLAPSPMLDPVETPPALRPSWNKFAVTAVLAGCALVAVGFFAALLRARRAEEIRSAVSKQIAKPIEVTPPPVAETLHPVRILAGSSVEKSVDRFGVEWLSDRYFIGGQQNHWGIGGKEMGVPNRVIRGAPDQLQFHSFRYGDFSYRIPLPKGKYELKLYFSEVIYLPTDFGDGVENRRVFNVLMNGQPLLTSFDIAADAGAADTADIRVFDNVSPVDGFLTLAFRPIISGAWLNAIEIIPNNTGRPLPIRIVTRNANITDHKGDLWEIDRYYYGGRQLSDGETVSGTADPELFKWQRYGNFTYRLPVPPGEYRLKLLFAETFYGPHNRGNGGPGSRIFNVYASGVRILHNFEIFKEVGEDRAIEKVFHRISPNAPSSPCWNTPYSRGSN
jgi:Malectin domain